MKSLSLEIQKMAALAVFNSLYNVQKDIYTVMSEFIKQIYAINGLPSGYTLEELREELINQFGFDNIPYAVVKNAVTRKLSLEKDSISGRYFIPAEQRDSYETISNELEEAEKDSELILTALINFYERQEKEQASKIVKDELQQALYQYLFNDKYYSKYSNIINLFIIKNEENEHFQSKLQPILEGCLIQAALKYQSSPNQLDKFNNTLYIYLDTEIIFHLAGYNGPFYQTLVQEFIQQVVNMNKEISKRHNDEKILLRYFEEVDKEIGNFFERAESIVKGKVPLDRTNNAMVTIVQDCHSASDVLAKKSELNLLLNKYKIILENKFNYYEHDREKYNIEDSIFISNIVNHDEKEKIVKSLILLSHVNVRRGNRPQQIFNNIGCILLTGNETTRRLSLDERVLTKGNVPLATDLAYLTNRFWFTTHQSFSKKNDLQSFKISTRARIAISANIARKAQIEYNKILQEYTDGQLSNESIAERLSELHQLPTMPESVGNEEENIADYYTILNANDIERLIEEKNIERNRQKEIISEKDQEILEKDKRIIELEERPLRFFLHIVLFLRSIVLYAVVIGTIICIIFAIIDICKEPKCNWQSIIALIGFIFSVCSMKNKKMRFWFSPKSFNRDETERTIKWIRNRENNKNITKP